MAKFDKRLGNIAVKHKLITKDQLMEAMETVDSIERTHGKTRLGQPEKINTFLQLMSENVDIQAIYDICQMS